MKAALSLVTWQATDIAGNTATCVQEFTIIPLTLDSLVFPPAYVGECGGSVHPSVTGWPQIDGIDLTDDGGLCNIFVGYWDKELNDCGGGVRSFVHGQFLTGVHWKS